MAEPTVPRIGRRNLAMKAEGTYGTDVFAGTVGAGDYVEAYNVQADPSIAMMDTPSMGGQFGSLGLVPGSKIGRVSFEMMARGAGAVYSASVFPSVHNPLRACGMLPTLTATGGSEKWVYTPRQSGFESFTVYVPQENGTVIKMTGCFGDCSVVFRVGDMVRYRFNLTGIYVIEADTPVFAVKVFSASPQWPTLLSAAFTFDSYTPDLASISLSLGNQIDVIEAANAASGIGGVYIADRRISAAIDPGVVTRAVYDWIAKWEAAGQHAMTFQTTGAQYVRHKISAPKASIRSRGWSTRGQKAVFGIGLDLGINAGNDELALTFD